MGMPQTPAHVEREKAVDVGGKEVHATRNFIRLFYHVFNDILNKIN